MPPNIVFGEGFALAFAAFGRESGTGGAGALSIAACAARNP